MMQTDSCHADDSSKAAATPTTGATEAVAADEILHLRQEAARYQHLRKKIRNIYRPGSARTEWYIDGQTLGWSSRGQEVGVDEAIDAEIANDVRRWA